MQRLGHALRRCEGVWVGSYPAVTRAWRSYFDVVLPRSWRRCWYIIVHVTGPNYIRCLHLVLLNLHWAQMKLAKGTTAEPREDEVRVQPDDP